MSYIAFDLDALNVSRDVGAAAGVPEERITHGLLRMWAWCFREKTDTVQAIQVQGFFGTSAAPALVAFGFLAPAGADFRVRGAERYLRVTEQRQKAGKARSSSAGRSAGRFTSDSPADHQRPPAGDQHTTSEPPALTPSTEHRAPNTIKEEEAIPPPPRSVERGALVYAPPDAPPGPGWKPEDFFRWFQVCRQTAGFVGEKWPRLNLSHWWAEVLGTPGMSVERLCEAVSLFGASAHWRERGLPFGAFAAQWRDFVPAARGAA